MNLWTIVGAIALAWAVVATFVFATLVNSKVKPPQLWKGTRTMIVPRGAVFKINDRLVYQDKQSQSHFVRVVAILDRERIVVVPEREGWEVRR